MRGVPVVNIGHEIIRSILSDRLDHLEFGWHGKCTLCFTHYTVLLHLPLMFSLLVGITVLNQSQWQPRFHIRAVLC